MTCRKEELIQSIRHEGGVIRQLARKLRPDELSWRPTSQQRSIGELMQYLTVCALVPAAYIRDGNWDAGSSIEEAAKAVTAETFDRAFRQQMEQVVAIIEAIPHADLAGRMTALPWGTPVSVGQALVDMVLKSLVAYRMQFFLYLKQSGRLELGPYDCWAATAK
jgi:hypothetical protein